LCSVDTSDLDPTSPSYITGFIHRFGCVATSR